MSHLSLISSKKDDGKVVTFQNSPFELHQPFPPSGDQPEAIDRLVEGIEDGLSYQTLLGVTGSGKIMRAKAYKSHILTKKSPKRKRNFRHETELSEADRRVVARNLGLR